MDDDFIIHIGDLVNVHFQDGSMISSARVLYMPQGMQGDCFIFRGLYERIIYVQNFEWMEKVDSYPIVYSGSPPPSGWRMVIDDTTYEYDPDTDRPTSPSDDPDFPPSRRG